jgi:hypothetical protein
MLISHTTKCLDTGSELPQPSTKSNTQLIIAVGACLLSLFDSLPNSLVPTSMHVQCAAAQNREAAFEVRAIMAFSKFTINKFDVYSCSQGFQL